MKSDLKYWISGVFCGIIITLDVLINLAITRKAREDKRTF